MCGVGAKPVAHLMKFHQLQWEVAQVKALMNSNMTLTVPRSVKTNAVQQSLRFSHQRTTFGPPTKYSSYRS